MSKTSMVMVYSATSEEEVERQYAASAAEAESSGYVPISEAWDQTTLTVTYQYRGDPHELDAGAGDNEPDDSGLWPSIRRWLRSG